MAEEPRAHVRGAVGPRLVGALTDEGPVFLDQGGGRGLEQFAVALLAFAQRLLGALALGDVPSECPQDR